jgi:hypothetical protein
LTNTLGVAILLAAHVVLVMVSVGAPDVLNNKVTSEELYT